MSSTARPIMPPVPAVQRYFEVSLFLLVATGILAVVSTGKLDPITLAVPPIALAYKGYRMWRGKGPEISVRFATELVLAYFLFFPLDLFFLSRSLAENAPNPALYSALLASIHLMLFATLVRLYSARTNRDYAFLSVLAVTCMLASAILTVETTFILALAVFLVLAVSTFVALEMRRSATGAVSPPLEPGSVMSRQLNRALGITSGLVALGALAIGAAIFFLIPRYTSGYLSALNLQPSLMTGFGDSVTLGQIGQIKQSTAVVMRVSIQGDAASQGADVHWRGIVFTNFDGKRWFTPSHDDIVISPDTDGEYRFPSPQPPAGEFRTMRYTVLMEPTASDALFVAPRITELKGRFNNGGDANAGPVRTSYLLLDHAGTISNPSHNDSKVRYEATSNVPLIPPDQLRAASREYPEQISATYLQLPPIDPRIAKLAEQVTRGATNDYDKASRIEAYLKTQFRYTLDLSGPKTDDPLAYFLFTKKAGHCEYFAAAMTVMLRSLGIPTRYVGGFLPGEYNDVGGDWIVRASDAHAWVEVFFTGHGWITFDPTPPSEAKKGGLLARLAMYWDSFQFAWGEWIINYDFVHQISLAQNVQRSSKNAGENARKYYESKRDAIMRMLIALDKKTEASPYFLPGVLAMLVAILIYLRGREVLGHLMARWSLRARSGNATASLATLEYREMLRLLEKRGWRKLPAQTPEEFAAAIPSGEVAVQVTQLTRLYQSARFGDRPAPLEQMSGLLAAIRAIVNNRKPVTQ